MSTALAVNPDDQPLEIHVEKGNGDEPVLPISWCISPEMYHALAAEKVEKAWVLLVIENDGEEMARYVYPLQTMMDRFPFVRPRTNIVHGLLFSPREGFSPKQARRWFTRRTEDAGYDVVVLKKRRHAAERLERELEELRDQIDQIAYQISEAQTARQTRVQKQSELVKKLAEVATRLDEAVPEALEDEADALARELRDFRSELEGQSGSEIAESSSTEGEEAPGTDLEIDELARLQAERTRLQAEVEQLEAAFREASQAEPDAIELETEFPVVQVHGHTAVEVDIAPGFYGTNWPITRKLAEVNSYKHPSRHQCDTRKRAGVGLVTLLKRGLLAPFAELFTLLATAFLLLLGVRNLDFGPLRHPIKQSPGELWEEAKPSFWFYRKSTTVEGDRTITAYPERNGFLWLVNPLVVLGVAMVILIVSNLVGRPVSALQALGLALGGILGVGVLVTAFMLGSMAVDSLFMRFRQKHRRTPAVRAEPQPQETKQRKPQIDEEEQLRRDIAARYRRVACGNQQGPPIRQRVVVTAKKAKGKVCKPLSR